MEKSVNERILLLKSELRLNDIEFCGKASISTATLFKIKNNEKVTQKILNSISSAFNVNPEWLDKGKGKMFNAEPKQEAVQSIDPWKDALVMQVKEENNRLQKELDRVWTMVQSLMGNKANFRKALDAAGLPMLFPGKSSRVNVTS